MGIELFGAHYSVHFATACFVAYAFSGRSGIYLSQRVGVCKTSGQRLDSTITLREVRDNASIKKTAKDQSP
jgi:hypothetical protein